MTVFYPGDPEELAREVTSLRSQNLELAMELRAVKTFLRQNGIEWPQPKLQPRIRNPVHSENLADRRPGVAGALKLE